MIPVRIISNTPIASEVYLLRTEKPFSFQPGQVTGVTINEKLPPRLYSIASGVHDDYIDILYDLKVDGLLTPVMSKLRSGNSILISEPSGIFRPVPDEKAWWIAAGTGIAPFASVLFSHKVKNITLIHGGRRKENFYFSERVEKSAGVVYLKCCTREKISGHYFGRLTNWLKEQEHLPLENKYYLCGSAEMVVETRDILVDKGIKFDQIIAEIYF